MIPGGLHGVQGSAEPQFGQRHLFVSHIQLCDGLFVISSGMAGDSARISPAVQWAFSPLMCYLPAPRYDTRTTGQLRDSTV
jgi:hypothetical protein